MAETITLTTPIARPSVTTYRVTRLVLQTAVGHPESEIVADLLGSDGSRTAVQWTGVTADGLIRALNTANLATKSLQHRILERAAQDFPHLAGTIAGTPD